MKNLLYWVVAMVVTTVTVVGIWVAVDDTPDPAPTYHRNVPSDDKPSLPTFKVQ